MIIKLRGFLEEYEMEIINEDIGYTSFIKEYDSFVTEFFNIL